MITVDLYNEIKKVFPKLKNFFSAKELDEFLKCNYEELYVYHFGFGTWIRNTILKDSSLYHAFLACGISQADDMSALIIQLFYIYLKENKQKTSSK